MVKLRNVSGIPVSFNGVNGTVRFLKGQCKTFKEKEITESLREGISSGSLISEQIEGQEQSVVTVKKTTKKIKEVTE